MRPPADFATERLRARRMAESDLDYMVTVDTDPVMQATLTGRISSRAESDARLTRWIDESKRSGLGFWLFHDTQGQAVGHGGLFESPRDPGCIELGYAVLPQFWGHGYATEMAIALRNLAHALKLAHVVALTRTTNAPSRRVLEKAGFRYERDLLANDILFARYVDG